MVAAIGITYYFVEKDSIALKIVSGSCLAAWIIVMLIINKNSDK